MGHTQVQGTGNEALLVLLRVGAAANTKHGHNMYGWMYSHNH